MKDQTQESYERDLEQARADGTDYLEREDDLPEPDRYQASREIATLFSEGGEDMGALSERIGLAGPDPSTWASLDLARAASYAREHHAGRFRKVAEKFPWLENVAAGSAHGAIGSLADKFLGHR